MVYIWEPGRAADQVVEALVQRARAGVQVRLLLDAFGAQVHGCLATNLQSAFTQLWASATGEVLLGDEFYPADPDGRRGEEGLSRHVNVISSPASGFRVIGVLDEDFGKQLRETFLADLEESREITPDVWKRRGILARLNERFRVSFVEQF